MRTFIILLISSCIGIPAFASNNSNEKLEVHDPWVREAPPTIKMLAGYFTLHNHSNNTHTILSVSSPQFSRVEIHRTEIKNDIARMLPVSKIILSPNAKVLLEPGGLHLMLIKPKKKYGSGDKIQLTLHLSDKSTFDFTAPVKKGHNEEDHSKHDMDHDSHDMAHESIDDAKDHSDNKHRH